GNLWYNEPKTLAVAFDVIGDVTLAAASQQYGGFTVASVDELLEPYAEKTYKKQYERYLSLGLSEEIADREAMKDVEVDFRQGFQGWE
ncbi:MAG TPA: anaerobic ribonucleoside-triphosphate reductase, partial [Ruminococcaceae bacterium]|nr:anaerobic ribonucleoside-triphosphate reductase [Oscillospiraceae bacterium]